MKRIIIRIIILVVLITGSIGGCGGDNGGDVDQTKFGLENAFPNFSFERPIDLQNSGDGTGRIFVAEHKGVIYVLSGDDDTISTKELSNKNLFLDIHDRVLFDESELGLLGFVFHPNFENNGYFYVVYIADNPPRTVISRFSGNPSNPNTADPDSEFIILEFDQPHSFHKGGQLVFGPGGYLYIGSVDGGPAGDPDGRGQDLTTVLGKILRIDVDNPDEGRAYGIPKDNPFAHNNSGFREEIFAYGLRNPWRFSFDALTGQIWAGDVGEQKREEIDIIENGNNYGWSVMEGSHCFKEENCDTTGLELPVWEYGRQKGDRAIIGGFVYRGTDLPELFGHYIYADFVTSRVWSLQYDGINKPINTKIIDFEDFSFVSFGIDEENELYICSFDGNVYRIVVE